jgi:hypothetical protein
MPGTQSLTADSDASTGAWRGGFRYRGDGTQHVEHKTIDWGHTKGTRLQMLNSHDPVNETTLS